MAEQQQQQLPPAPTSPTTGAARDILGGSGDQSALSLPPPVLSAEAESWITSNNLYEFMPFLREAGFIDIDSISTITEADAEAIGISQLGARRRLVRAIQRLATTLPPSPLPHPHLTPQRAGAMSSPVTPYTAIPALQMGSPTDLDDEALSPTSKKKRGPMRCGKCHQWKKTCHGHCMVRCTSFATCPTRHRRAHPELKEEEKQQRRREEDDRKRRRDDDTDELKLRREKKAHNDEDEEEGSGIVNGVNHHLPIVGNDVLLLETGQNLVVPSDASNLAHQHAQAQLHHQQAQTQHHLQQQQQQQQAMHIQHLPQPQPQPQPQHHQPPPQHQHDNPAA